jgi:hypothetical protein
VKVICIALGIIVDGVLLGRVLGTSLGAPDWRAVRKALGTEIGAALGSTEGISPPGSVLAGTGT